MNRKPKAPSNVRKGEEPDEPIPLVNDETAKRSLRHKRNVYDAAVMYFVQGKTNKEIADRLRIKPSTVVALRKEAIEKKIINVSVNLPGSMIQAALESRLIERFDLEDAKVALDSSATKVKECIGREAAAYFKSHKLFQSGAVVGIDGGSILANFAHNLEEDTELKNILFCPIVATFTITTDGFLIEDPYSFARSSTFVAFEAASRLGGGPDGKQNIQAMAACDSLVPIEARYVHERLGEINLTDRRRNYLDRLLDAIVEKDGLLILGGSTPAEDHYSETMLKLLETWRGNPEPADPIQTLRASGGTAFTGGKFYDNRSVLVSCDLNSSVSSVSLDQIRSINEKRRMRMKVVMISGGEHRVPGMEVILNSGLITHLITDLETARSLVGDAE